MTAPVILLCFFFAFCALSVGTPLTCPPPFLNESAQQGSGRLCATLQLQTKLPCPSVNLSVRENEKLNPEKWHLKSLSLKVENTCSFMVFELDKERERFPGGFYSSIAVNSIDTQSEFLCVCKKLHIRNRRTPTFNDFMAKHLVEIPENPSDEDWQRIWDDASKYREQKNSNIPRRQSFMDRNKFNSRFTRDFRIKASDGRILYRSENKMRIYDVTNNGGTLRTVPRNGYVVAGLDNNNRPVHFEAVPKEYEEHLEKMKPGQTVSIGRKVGASNLPRGVGRTVEIIEEVVEPVAEGEGIAMTVIGTTAATTSAATVFTSILHVLTLFLI